MRSTVHCRLEGQKSEDRTQKAEVRSQMSENREPQNIESRMLNIEVKENFIISASGGFDIQIGQLMGC